MIAMSSFLMNSGSSYVVDPKFPPSEEYSQSSYIPAAASDYYVPHQVQHYHGYHHHSVNSTVNGGGHPSSVTASMGYYGQHPSHGSAGGYGGAYGAPCGIAPGQQAVPMTGHVAPTSLGHHHHQHSQQHQQSPGLIPRSPAPSPTPSLTSMGVTCPSQIQPQQNLQQHQQQQLQLQQHQHVQQQPLHQQQQLNSSHLQQQSHGVVSQALMQHDQLSHLGSMVAQQSNGQQQLQSQTQIQQSNALQLCQPPTPNSPESDCDDGSDMSDDSHNPVIYPWMKKIHVAGARKFKSRGLLFVYLEFHK